MGTIKDRNGMDLTQAQDIKKWQQYAESESESEVAQSCLTLCDPMDSSLHQAPPSMGFSRQEYWSGCHFLLQKNYTKKIFTIQIITMV